VYLFLKFVEISGYVCLLFKKGMSTAETGSRAWNVKFQVDGTDRIQKNSVSLRMNSDAIKMADDRRNLPAYDVIG
jgi:hypothetical protein